MNTQPQYGSAVRSLALLGCLISGSAIGPAPVPRKDSIGETQQITTFTAGGATNDETYTVTFTSSTPGSVGDVIAITTEALDGSATILELVAALQAAMYASPAFMRYVESVATTSTTVVVTFKRGQSGTFVLTDNPNTDLSQAATQAAAAFQEYTFGRAVEVLGPLSGASTENQRIRPLPADTHQGALATVTVTTPDSGSDCTIVFGYKPFGGAAETRTLTFTSTASGATTVDAAVSAAELLFPTATVADNTTNATIRVPPGDELSVISVTNEGTLVVAAEISEVADDLPRCAIVYNDQIEPIADTYPTPSVPTGVSGRAIPTLDAGEVQVAANDASVDFGSLAYAETADGADKGKLFKTPSATRIPVLTGNGRIPARFGALDPADSSLVSLRLGA